MPIGPNGEKRPANVIANAVRVARIATREDEEEYINPGQSAGGRKGGAARAESLSAERRREIAQAGASARWSTDPTTSEESSTPIAARGRTPTT